MSSPSPSITHDAIEQNAQGVQFLESAKYGDAVAAFSKSLSTIKTILSDYRPPQDEQEQGEADGSKFLTTQKLIFQFSNSNCTKKNKRLDLEEETESSPASLFVFQNPITVSFHTQESAVHFTQDAEFRSLVKFSSALLFNLALSYHLAGNAAQDVSSQRKKLKKALTFYKLTYTMMQDTMDIGVMETLAIVNNLGHVQRVLGDLEKSKLCYEHLLSTIMYVSDTGDRDAIQNFDGFFQSVQSTVLAPPPTAQAA